MVAGLEDISGGTISIGGSVVNDLAPKERNIAMVFQNYALYPHMTVAQNMAFSLRLSRVPRAEMRQKVERAAEILGLGQLLDRYPAQLSGGQRQRVAMGRAIVREPEVFLFDEPLSNLDAKLRVQMRTEIGELHQRLRTTTIYVTHDQIEAMTMADRIVVMNGGRVEQVGSPLDLYDRPANLFVAGFIGSPAMNFLSGRIEEGQFRTGSGLAAPLPPGLSRPAGNEVIGGIRPDQLRLGEDGARAEVAVVEPTGAETLVVLRLAGAPVQALIRDRRLLRPGDAVGLSIEPGGLHLFDAATGLRL
jgi:multiple sugar transport system ATP-binding protein